MGWSAYRTAWLAWIQQLYTGYFACVMATGIVSIALLLNHTPFLSDALWAIGGVLLLFLLAIYLLRWVRYPRDVQRDATDPTRLFGYFTLVAGCGVLATRAALNSWVVVPAILTAIAVILWLLFLYWAFAVLLFTNERPIEQSVNGAWLIVIVATESLAITWVLLAHVRAGLMPALQFLSYAFWTFGVLLYLIFMDTCGEDTRCLQAREEAPPSFRLTCNLLYATILEMETTLTAKLKLVTTREQFQALRATQLAYRDALNVTSAHAFANGKTSNSKKLHRDLYEQIRGEYGMPSQMACSVFRQVGATYKALWTKWRKNQEARAAGYTKRRFKGLDDAPKYVSPTLTYVYGHDYSLRTEQEVSVLTLAGRIHIPYQGYGKHMALMQHGAIIGGAKLWYDRAKRRFYLLVSLTTETPDPTPTDQKQIIGVDVGSRYLATVATLGNGCQFFSGKEVRSKADHYARLQKRLQRKGTRSATRRRIVLGQRERRLKLNTNHAMSTHILCAYPHSFIGLEDLNGIRERTKRRRYRRKGKQVLPVSASARKANRHAAKWALAELQGMLAYKAALGGSLCIKLDADYTSQACPKCGFTSKGNRPKKGLLFVCQNCHYTLHADLVGARNIALRTLVIRQAWMTTGQLSSAPDVTDCEAKAARLSRYAELRWSPVTSSLPSGGSI